MIISQAHLSQSCYSIPSETKKTTGSKWWWHGQWSRENSSTTTVTVAEAAKIGEKEKQTDGWKKEQRGKREGYRGPQSCKLPGGGGGDGMLLLLVLMIYKMCRYVNRAIDKNWCFIIKA